MVIPFYCDEKLEINLKSMGFSFLIFSIDVDLEITHCQLSWMSPADNAAVVVVEVVVAALLFK